MGRPRKFSGSLTPEQRAKARLRIEALLRLATAAYELESQIEYANSPEVREDFREILKRNARRTALEMAGDADEPTGAVRLRRRAKSGAKDSGTDSSNQAPNSWDPSRLRCSGFTNSQCLVSTSMLR